jgi:hypothetical protein
MKYLVTILQLCFSLCAYGNQPTPLSGFEALQWQQRIILVNNLQDPQSVLTLFEQNKTEIKERDIIWFVFSGDEAHTNYQGALSGDFIAKTRASYQLESGKIMLIGKDGGVKILLDRMDLEAIFNEIDAMPMRQNEMVH